MNILRLLYLLPAIMAIACRPDPKETLRTDLNELLNDLPGRHAVAFIPMEGSDSLMIRPDAVFHAASTMKTPVMVELYRQAQTGELTMDDSVAIRNEFRSIVDGRTYSLSAGDDSDTAAYNMVGKKTTIRELLRRMITVSSNLATNILIERVNPGKVEKTLRSMGLNNMRVLRGVEDQAAFEAGLNNVTTARDQALLYESIARMEAADSASCREMIDILSAQEFNEGIPAGLPAGTKVAHKTGWIRGVRHDGGIVMLPDGRSYVLVILTSGWTDDDQAVRTMAAVSRRVHEYISGTDR